jgi:hypothetical protein
MAIFKNDKNQNVEVHGGNFSHIPPGSNLGLTPVRFKDGSEEWLRATEDEIKRASVESPTGH